MTLEGAGTVAFPANSSGIVLNNADGVLKLEGTGTAQKVLVSTSSNAGKGILINESGTLANLKISADTELNIDNGKTLYGSIEVSAENTLSLIGTGTLNSSLNLLGTLEAAESLEVSGKIIIAGDSTISIPDSDTTLIYSGSELTVDAYTFSIGGSGTFSNNMSSPIVLSVEESILDLTGNGTITGEVRLDGCTLKASGSPTISGNITQSDDATIEVSPNQTLSYSGSSLNLGSNKLTLTGTGDFSNSNALVLNDADSLLSLEGIGTIGVVNATVEACLLYTSDAADE